MEEIRNLKDYCAHNLLISQFEIAADIELLFEKIYQEEKGGKLLFPIDYECILKKLGVEIKTEAINFFCEDKQEKKLGILENKIIKVPRYYTCLERKYTYAYLLAAVLLGIENTVCMKHQNKTNQNAQILAILPFVLFPPKLTLIGRKIEPDYCSFEEELANIAELDILVVKQNLPVIEGLSYYFDLMEKTEESESLLPENTSFQIKKYVKDKTNRIQEMKKLLDI